jgi:hypothetical protein
MLQVGAHRSPSHGSDRAPARCLHGRQRARPAHLFLATVEAGHRAASSALDWLPDRSTAGLSVERSRGAQDTADAVPGVQAGADATPWSPVPIATRACSNPRTWSWRRIIRVGSGGRTHYSPESPYEVTANLSETFRRVL